MRLDDAKTIADIMGSPGYAFGAPIIIALLYIPGSAGEYIDLHNGERVKLSRPEQKD